MTTLTPLSIEDSLHIVENNIQDPSIFVHENGAFHIEPIPAKIGVIRTSTRDVLKICKENVEVCKEVPSFLDDYVVISKEDI